jgi:hypothetical protein
MRVADLHMRIDDMGAPDASLQMGALVVRSRRRRNHYSPDNRSRAAAAHPKCAASGLQFPSSPYLTCSRAECRPVIAAHQQEQPVAVPTYDELSVATVEDEPRAR